MTPASVATYPLPGVTRPSLIELAIDLIQEQVENQFNANLTLVSDMYRDDKRKIVLEGVQPNNIYIAEGIKALKLPAIFLIPDRTDFDLTWQNANVMVHSVIMGVVVEDVAAEANRITRKALRYGRAAWMTVHDQFLGGPARAQQIHVLVESEQPSPAIYAERAGSGDRTFRKDVTLRLRVQHFEPLYT